MACTQFNVIFPIIPSGQTTAAKSISPKRAKTVFGFTPEVSLAIGFPAVPIMTCHACTDPQFTARRLTESVTPEVSQIREI